MPANSSPLIPAPVSEILILVFGTASVPRDLVPSMKTRIFDCSSAFRACALIALAAASSAAAIPAAAPAIVIYYSFDSPPAPETLASMKTEVGRIFDPARLSIGWRQLDRQGGEVAAELVVVRFRGSCTADALQ